MGYRGPQNRRNLSSNIPIRVGSKLEMWNKVMAEVRVGRYAGPYLLHELPFNSWVQSPIGLVPKLGNLTRLIFHLSFDFGDAIEQKLINFHTPDRLCSIKYKDLDYAVKMCLNLKNKMEKAGQPNHPIFLTKTDLQNAFRLLPVKVHQRKFLLLKAAHPITNETFFFYQKMCQLWSQFLMPAVSAVLGLSSPYH